MTAAYDWTGRVGDSWADEWRRTDLSFSGLTPSLNAAILAVAPDEGSAVDIGCGAGETCIALAVARPGLSVTGVDLSQQLVAVAADRGAGHGNLRFATGDAARLDERDVDLFVSRHGVMFFDDPVAAFTALRRAAAPNAAMIFSCFRSVKLNPWASDPIAALGAPPPPSPGTEPAPGPFAFADPARVERILAASGWHGGPQAVDYAYRAGEGPAAIDEAAALFSRIGPTALYLASLDDGARSDAHDTLRAFLADRVDDGVIEFPASAWIWSCRAAEGATA